MAEFQKLREEFLRLQFRGFREYAEWMKRLNPRDYFEASKRIGEATAGNDLLAGLEKMNAALNGSVIYLIGQHTRLGDHNKVESSSVKVQRIPHASHFMMFDNENCFYRVLTEQIRQYDK